jgi:hypothetical protein
MVHRHGRVPAAGDTGGIIVTVEALERERHFLTFRWHAVSDHRLGEVRRFVDFMIAPAHPLVVDCKRLCYYRRFVDLLFCVVPLLS